MVGIGFEGWPMAAGAEYLHTIDLARKGIDLASVLRTWLDSDSETSTLAVPPGTELRSLPAAWALPVAVTLVTGLDGELTRGSSLVLLSPDEAALDSAACYLNTISRVLVLLGDDGPTITGWLRRYRATHMRDRNVLTLSGLSPWRRAPRSRSASAGVPGQEWRHYQRRQHPQRLRPPRHRQHRDSYPCRPPIS